MFLIQVPMSEGGLLGEPRGLEVVRGVTCMHGAVPGHQEGTILAFSRDSCFYSVFYCNWPKRTAPGKMP